MLTVLLQPDNGVWRKGVWSDVNGSPGADDPLERRGGVISWEARNDDHVISKFKENGYKINLMVDTVPSRA